MMMFSNFKCFYETLKRVYCSYIGSNKLHNFQHNFSFPEVSESLKHYVIVDIFLKHLSNAPNMFCEQIKFRKWFQIENKFIQGFLAQLRKIMSICTLTGDILNDNFQQQFLKDLKKENIQNKLCLVLMI